MRGGQALSHRLKRGSARQGAPPEPAPAPLGRGGLWLILALALVGLALALELARIHAQAHAGVASFCALSETVNCDLVATSAYSVFLGLPVAVWGVFGYAAVGGLAAWGLAPRRPHPAWPRGILLVLAAVAVAAAIALALVSELVIGAWCLLCMGSWAVSAAILVAAWRAARPVGIGDAIRGDLRAASGRPGWLAAVAGVAIAAVAAAAFAYPRYWERRAPPPAPATPPAPAAARGGPITIVEYSDYDCPYCAMAHEQSRELYGGRDDVVVVRRQFPLDAGCNPAVRRDLHPGACGLARAAICAREQGQFDAMDDLLFRTQKARRPVEALAVELGLDPKRFQACLDAPETAQRLATEIAEGIQAGVRATPTYVIDGRVYQGVVPPGVVPARAARRP